MNLAAIMPARKRLATAISVGALALTLAGVHTGGASAASQQPPAAQQQPVCQIGTGVSTQESGGMQSGNVGTGTGTAQGAVPGAVPGSAPDTSQGASGGTGAPVAGVPSTPGQGGTVAQPQTGAQPGTGALPGTSVQPETGLQPETGGQTNVPGTEECTGGTITGAGGDGCVVSFSGGASAGGTGAVTFTTDGPAATGAVTVDNVQPGVTQDGTQSGGQTAAQAPAGTSWNTQGQGPAGARELVPAGTQGGVQSSVIDESGAVPAVPRGGQQQSALVQNNGTVETIDPIVGAPEGATSLQGEAIEGATVERSVVGTSQPYVETFEGGTTTASNPNRTEQAGSCALPAPGNAQTIVTNPAVPANAAPADLQQC